ncbi:aminotransferase class III-fold pyridoxal phosphate-dependent enzyme [Aquimarina sp. BL5]|uniref:aminotransferase class III-fold pyridoxal phosphate-dependent enzyme n=1 Tax=Aquimarina sp. BL5 TaxID=1714860 RepID=UPI000E5058B8|nr:aminotransferase class III-fold pyridoxal phosphate-dependent enzyme [Aquimarina sp. BL5]AXT51936.1 aminotransferase class III-fold pyridoxal phosphate-dependent enzyme [Aquimarina sp. BL5]RKN03797.1 aminotransferase class III-fold pyridoxal phosphate-dependent enzyme [Aquimarina sp. BL5]
MEDQLIFGYPKIKTTAPILRQASEEQLDHIKNRISRKAPTFLSSINPVFEETVQVAFMLCEIINNYQKREKYKTFFANSYLEAIHGAIKIARTASKEIYKKEEGEVVFYDAGQRYQFLFDPLQEGCEKALIPGITFYTRLKMIQESIEKNNPGIVLISIYQENDEKEVFEIIRQIKRKEIVTVLDLSGVDINKIHSFGDNFLQQFDCVVWGEALSDNQFPFGAFSTRDTIYKPWNSLDTCLTHSSTYGGNGMVLSYVRKVIRKEFMEFHKKKYLKKFKKVETSSGAKYKMAASYINRYTNVLFRTTTPMNFKKVSGSQFYTNKEKKPSQKQYLDCVGGSGCNLIGHNRDEIITEVIDKHNVNVDYFASLEASMAQQTGLDVGFMGNSGASAVETAIIMALLANKGKKKIVVFSGNYAGKTLVAINGTSDDHSNFEPLYAEVEMINPFAGSARYDLEKVLKTNEVALVWFEYIQGGVLLKLPPDLISLLNKYKETFNYLIGVDEILHGVYRTGNFLSIHQTKIKPDIITFSKALSNMTLPVSLTMMSEGVYKRAVNTNNKVVCFYEEIFKNQLAAHLAGNVLNTLEENNISENVKKQSLYLKTSIEKIFANSPYYRNVEMSGLHIRFNLNMKKYPFKFFSFSRISNIITHIFYKKGKIITYYGRMLPPLNMSDKEAKQLIEGLDKVVNVPKWYYIWVGIKQYMLTRFHTKF